MSNLCMPIKDAIEFIKQMIHEPISEAELYCAEMYYGAGNLVFQDIEDYALNTALRELEKADKYQRHDLRKNPEDLPVPYKDLLMVFEIGEIRYRCGWYGGEGFCSYEGVPFYPVAWQYIEPSKEVE